MHCGSAALQLVTVMLRSHEHLGHLLVVLLQLLHNPDLCVPRREHECGVFAATLCQRKFASLDVIALLPCGWSAVIRGKRPPTT